MANEKMEVIVGELMKAAGIEELACKPDPTTGELICMITDEQAEALKTVGFEPKRVVFEIHSETRQSEGEKPS